MYNAYIKSMKKSSLFSIFFIGLLFFFYSGCSNIHDKDEKFTKQNISGIVQKGNFIDGTLTAQRVKVNGLVFGKIVSVPIDNKAQYSLNLSWKGLTLLKAKGRFFNEYTGKNSTDEVELFALVDIGDDDSSKKVNLNLFTSLEYYRVIELMKGGTSYVDALASTKSSMHKLFGLSKDINASTLDAYDMNGTLKEENKNLLLFSGTLLKVLDSANTEKQSQKTEKRVQKFNISGMKKLFGDFGDNGLLDGIAKQTYDDMVEDDEESTWNRATDNIGVGEVEAPVGDWSIPGSTGTTFEIKIFSLKRIKFNGVLKEYNNESALLIGSASDTVQLHFDYNADIGEEQTPIYYQLAVYAVAGDETLMVFPYSSYYIINDGELSSVNVDVSNELRDFLKEAYRRGDEVKFKAVSDVALNVTSYVTKTSDVLPKLVSFSDKLNINGTDLNITSATLVSKNSETCENISGAISPTENTQYARFNMDVKWQPSKNWSITDGNLSNGCVRLDYNNTINSFDMTLIEENVKLSSDSISATIGGGNVKLAITGLPHSLSPNITPNGALQPFMFFMSYIPKDISVHIEDANILIPLEKESLIMFSNTLNISNNWNRLELKPWASISGDEHYYLHNKKSPFYISLSDNPIILDSTGLHISNVSAKYIHDGDRNELISNDILFSNPTGDFNITINENGLQTETPIHFDAVANTKTHFPYTTMTQGAFDVNIVNGVITPLNVTGEGKYKMGYSSECSANDSCSDGGNSTIAYTLKSSTRYISKDGAFMSSVDMTGKKIAWGSKKDGKNIFERDADKKGIMYVPGFSIDAKEPKALISTLLGSRDIDDGKLTTSYSLDNDESKKGNGLFAGVNVGSLYLAGHMKDSIGGKLEVVDDPILHVVRSTNSLTSLAGTTMTIQVGGKQKTSLTLNSNAKSKYYIRPSGVTGVFNGSLAQANEELSIYGYPMTFKRFAFSQVANKLNDKTLIDGDIAVIGKGGFKVDFSSLALDCTGALKGGTVDETDCDASPTVNCKQELKAWKTNTQFVSVDFQENAEDVCSDKTLKIAHVLDVKALTNPLGLTTTWTPAGDPVDSTVSGSSSNFLDRNEDNASSKGFAITLDTDTILTDEGWYKSSGAFGLPFWGMQPVDLGLTNKTKSTRALTRVMPRNLLNQSTYASNKAQKFMAAYQWGSTGFGFELPVVYNAKEANEESIFIGKKLEIDLGVMNANAGVNYIKPNDTKISFGASADFEAMGKLQIKIDLNDPESIKKIDDTLDTFGIDGDPVYNTIGKVLDPLHEAEAYADKGLLLGMEELGVLALEQGVDELGTDPFELVANTMVEMHTLPIQAIDMTEEYMLEKFDEKIGLAFSSVNSILNKTAETTDDALLKSKVKALGLLKDVLEQFKTLDEIKSQLQDVDNVLALVDINNSWNYLNSKISEIIPEKSSCTVENLSNKSKLFEPVFTLRDNILDIDHKIQAIPMKTVKSFASKVDKKINYDTSYLVHSVEKTQSVSSSLVGKISNAQGKVDEQLEMFCTQADGIRDEIQTLVDKQSEMNSVVSKLRAYIVEVRKKLNDVENIRTQLDNYKTTLEKFDPTVDSIEQDKIDQLSKLSSISLVDYIKDINVSNISLTDLRTDLNNTLKQIPQPTADELRHMVVTKILDTEPVANIRVAMNDAVSPVMDEVREVVVELFSSVNKVIYDVFDKLSAKANKALAEATSAVKSMPIKSGKMDGYALISGDELDRLHVGAEWAIDTGDEDTSYSFNGALDMERWGAGGKAGCGGETSTDGNMDVKISTRDIKLDLGAKEMSVDELYFGFTLQNALPIGIFGGIESQAGFDFNKFALYDMKLLVGIGAIETYLGTKAAAIFDVYQMNAAFLVGKTCGKEIITKLDPEVAEFITLPNNVFKGAYIRGGASFPIWDNGCALTVGVTADLGAWVLIPGTYGGLIGGGAYGKALCIAALKGQVKALFQKSGDNIKFQGSGWGAAGAGSCEPSKWHSVAKSRKDSWCGTGDAQFGAEYDDGWKLLDIDTDAVF